VSSMIPSPPPSIQIGGPGPGPGAPTPSGPPGDRLMAALDKLAQDATDAMALARDPGDRKIIAKIVAQLHALTASHQDALDSVMGGGAGAKIMRRNGGV
jgi:hypothetical protein